MSWLPLFHDMGLIGFVVGPLFTDIPCVFLPTASFVRAPRLWLDTIHQHRGTITYAPNFAYALVAKRLKDKDVEGLDLSCLRVAGCGAEPIQAKTLRDFAERLAPAGFDPRAFLPSYGMAEATLAITFVPLRRGPPDRRRRPEGARRRAGQALGRRRRARSIVDCGRPFPGTRSRSSTRPGRRLGERQVGQIVARGPSVARGYFDEPELTAQTFKPVAGRGDGDLAPHRRPRLPARAAASSSAAASRTSSSSAAATTTRATSSGPSASCHSVRRGNVVAFGVQANARGAW